MPPTPKVIRPEYLRTWFEAQAPAGGWPPRFTIITAFNPEGEAATWEENVRRDAALAAALDRRGAARWRVIGGDETFTHTEAGYGVVGLSLAEARALGAEFQQEAIFRVEGNAVVVAHCTAGAWAPAGAWPARQRTLPALVVAADWSANAPKRHLVRAVRELGTYVVHAPEPVGVASTLLERLAQHLPPGSTALLGLDFPIGLPERYAEAAGCARFLELLPRLGQEAPWAQFYTATEQPTLHQPLYPPRSMPKGRFSPEHLAAALGLTAAEQLRRCDRAAPHRGAASSLFYTLGARQVGKAAAHGWREVLAPGLRAGTLRLWPFHGTLPELLQEPGWVAAEIYPRDAGHQLGCPGGTPGRSKDDEAYRRTVAPCLLKQPAVRFTPEARAAIESGFKSGDEFDAMVGLLAMLPMARQPHLARVPESAAVRNVEGWILSSLPYQGDKEDGWNAAWTMPHYHQNEGFAVALTLST